MWTVSYLADLLKKKKLFSQFVHLVPISEDLYLYEDNTQSILVHNQYQVCGKNTNSNVNYGYMLPE